MTGDHVAQAFRRLAGGRRPDVETAVRTLLATARTVAVVDAPGAGSPAGPIPDGDADAPGPDTVRLLDALVVLHWVQAELGALEPALIEAARAAGASWQDLAPALGVASRQAAERRYLRLVPPTAGQEGSTRDERVRAERDRRAGRRAVARWANENTADLRRLAGQVTALTDLGAAADADLGRLHQALADPDATELPSLLAETHRHLAAHPDLADRIDAVTSNADRVRRKTQRDRRRAARSTNPP